MAREPMSNNRWQRPVLYGMLLLFALLYVLLAVVNHLRFRSFCLDLGVYSKALYDYAHLHPCDSSIYLWEPCNFLHDHFDLWLIALSPLSWLFGQYTLIVVQIVFVLIGAVGCWRLLCSYTESPLLPLMATFSYLAFFGTWHALGFDYHTSVLAAQLLPWLLLALRRERLLAASLQAAAICVAKETMPLWMLGVFAALLFDYWRNRRVRRWLWVAIGCVTGYFLLVTMVLIPLFGKGSSPGFWRYSYMGDDMGGVLQFVISHPWQTIVNFFTNFTTNVKADYVKLELALCLLASGGLVVALRNPHWLLMALPVLVWKWLSSDEGFWGITYHYNTEFAPVTVCGAFIALAEWHSRAAASGRPASVRKWIAAAAVLLAMLTSATTFYTCDDAVAPVNGSQLHVFHSSHYVNRDFDTHTARELLRQVPPEASVCATTMFVPHLAMRDSVYLFPIGLKHSPEYFLLLHHSWTYYEGEEDEVAALVADTVRYEPLYDDGMLCLLRRR